MNARDFGLLLTFVVLLGIGIGFVFSLPRASTIGTPFEEFERNLAIWELQKPEHYSARLHKISAFQHWIADVVVSGSTSTMKLLHEPETLEERSLNTDRRYYPNDIDNAFEIVSAGYAAKAYRIDVTFDAKYGFPAEARVDMDKDWVDDEWTLQIDEFEHRGMSPN